MDLREKLLDLFIRTERLKEKGTEAVKKTWRKLTKGEKTLVVSLLFIGTFQVVVGLALILVSL